MILDISGVDFLCFRGDRRFRGRGRESIFDRGSRDWGGGFLLF